MLRIRRKLWWHLLLYVLVVIAVSVTAPLAIIQAIWILVLLAGSAILLGVILSFWFEGGAKRNLQRALDITFSSVAIFFLAVYCLFCLSVWI